MWRSKKFIIAAVLAVVVLAASIGGVALAADNEDDSETAAPFDTLWEKMATVLQDDGVDVTSDQLKSAFNEAQEGLRADALQSRLDALVAEGKITQEQADAYSEWREAKPDMGDAFGFGGNRGLFRERIKMPGMDGMPGMGRMRGFGGFSPPVEETD